MHEDTSTECFRRSLCHKVKDVLPPITEYDHSVGYSITGGYVYRGPDAPALVGQYLFGDFGSGRIWAVRREGERWIRRQLLDTRAQIASFAEGLDGALYVVSYRRDKPTLLRVLPVEYDDLTIAELEPGRRFLERSTMMTLRRWMPDSLWDAFMAANYPRPGKG